MTPRTFDRKQQQDSTENRNKLLTQPARGTRIQSNNIKFKKASDGSQQGDTAKSVQAPFSSIEHSPMTGRQQPPKMHLNLKPKRPRPPQWNLPNTRNEIFDFLIDYKDSTQTNNLSNPYTTSPQDHSFLSTSAESNRPAPQTN